MSWKGGIGGAACCAMILGCHSARPEGRLQADTCAAPVGELPPSASAEALVGEYHVRFVATAGPKQGATEDGRVTLRPMDDSLVAAPPVLGIRDSTTRHPLVGSAQIDVDALGATRTGELASADMHAPGVLVIERHPIQPAARAEITLRLGAEANRRGIVRYDGGYFALKVLRVGPSSFAGTWISGGAGSTARGYFCAARPSR